MTDTRKRILYVQYTDPGVYPPLDHSSHILAAAGWEVAFLGIALHPQMMLTPHPRIQVKNLPEVTPGWRQKVHYFYYLLWVMVWVLRWRPIWIYASDPLSSPIALLLTYLQGLKVLYHEHDSPDERTSDTAFMRLILKTRRQVARWATVNVLPNNRRTELFREATTTHRPIITVWNCPTLREVSTPRTIQNSRLKLLYHGALVEGQGTSLALLQALAILPDHVDLHLIGYETSPYSKVIMTWRTLAEKHGVAHRLFIHPPLPRHDLLKVVPAYDVGIGFMPRAFDNLNYQGMVGASNKAFDYMAGGLVLLVNDEEAWQTTYEHHGFGLSCNPDKPLDIANKIKWLVDHPTERHLMGESGRQQILKSWNYEAQFQPVLEILETSLRTPTTVLSQ